MAKIIKFCHVDCWFKKSILKQHYDAVGRNLYLLFKAELNPLIRYVGLIS